MTWNYRQGGSWQTPTLKCRQNGQWVTVGSDNSGSGGSVDTSMYYTDGPPERSGSTITYDGTSYSSITSLLHSGDVNEGDSVYIDPSNSPYTEHIDIDPGDETPDHITIYSDWDISYNSNGIATINQQGATVNAPSDDGYALTISRPFPNPENWGTTSLVGSYDGLHEGVETTEIEVNDSSGINAGDQIVIHEDTRPYGLEPSGGASGAGDTMEFANVEAVDGNTITIDMPLAMNYPNNNATDVGPVDWTAEDIHVHGLRFDAGGESCAFIGAAFKCWFNDIIGRNAGSTPTIFNQTCFYNRFDNIYMYDGSHYGLNNQDGSTRTMATRMMGENHNRYTVRFGPRGHSTPRGYVNQIAGNGLRRTVGGVHQGGHWVDYENMTATGTRAIVMRSWHMNLDGFEVNGGNDVGPPLVCAQQPGYVTVKNGDISGMDGTGQAIWGFRLRGSSAPYGPERLEHVTYENISIEPYDSRDKTSLGYFETDDDSPTSGPLTFRDIYYGGDKLTQSDVEAWNGYDSNVIPYLTVE